MTQDTYRASAIRHLATGDGDIFAAALFKHTVLFWNVATGALISQFETVLDFGGTRLALAQAESACLAAAYHRHGLACYEVPSGALRWQRRDLKKIQQVALAADRSHVYCCFDEGPCQVVSIANGETAARLHRVHRIWIDPQSGFQLRKSGELSVLNGQGEKVFGIAPGSFAVLDASFGPRQLAVSESGADVRFFDVHSGQEIARHTQPKNHHVLRLSSFPDGILFHAVQWNYNEGGPKLLLRYRSDSLNPHIVRDIGQPAEVRFCFGGRQLITSEGELIDCVSGKTLREFDFPVIDYPKK
jgi:hypothetical protein